jgi:hypothetical protein
MNFYTLGPKATIAVVPKFGLKLVKNEVIQLNDGRMNKNKTFRDLVNGGSLRKLSEVEAQELISKGFKDVTYGRRNAEAATEQVESTEEDKAAAEAKAKAEAALANTFGAWLKKADKVAIMSFLENSDDNLVPAEKYEEATGLSKVGELREFVSALVGEEYLNSEFKTA